MNGIPFDIFLDSNQALKEKHPEVVQRILFALGISTHIKSLQISWDQFLKLHQYLKYFTASSKDYVKFWVLVRVINLIPIVYES